MDPTSGADPDLLELARRAADAAYSPYSGVRVGAALRASDGSVFVGCNVENASYGLTLCAERTALVKAVSEGARTFDAIAIWSNRSSLLMPCGACRQMLHEFAPELAVGVGCEGGDLAETGLDLLLPHGVAPSDVK